MWEKKKAREAALNKNFISQSVRFKGDSDDELADDLLNDEEFDEGEYDEEDYRDLDSEEEEALEEKAEKELRKRAQQAEAGDGKGSGMIYINNKPVVLETLDAD